MFAQFDYTTVHERIDVPGYEQTTITVPSGKIWKVHLNDGGGGDGSISVYVNGSYVVGSNNTAPKVLVTGGDTLEFDNSDNRDGNTVVTGFEIDESEVDNDPISIALGEGESVSKPQGEVWMVNIRGSMYHLALNTTNTDNYSINGYASNNVRKYANQVVIPEDVTTLTASSEGHISGWVVNNV